MKLISLILFIQITHGSSIVYQGAGEMYWPAMNVEEEELEIIEESENKRLPASKIMKYKTVDELQDLVDVCWYRCTFEVRD